MKRHFRHISSLVSLLLVVCVGLFFALPHDVCISKLASSSGCVCAPASSSNGNCCCCGPAAAPLACGDADSGADSHAHSTSDSGGAICFAISSDQAQMTGPERVIPHAPVFVVLAVLPLASEIVTPAEPVRSLVEASVANGKQVYLHRDNCVYLI